MEILGALPLGLVGIRGSWQPQQRTLARDTDLRMRGLNQLPFRLRSQVQLFFPSRPVPP